MIEVPLFARNGRVITPQLTVRGVFFTQKKRIWSECANKEKVTYNPNAICKKKF